MRDYTPSGAAVTAGDMIKIDGLVYVAHLDIADGELGALSSPDGSAAYRITLKVGDTFADGVAVTVDTSAGTTNGALGDFFGYAEGAWDQTAGDTFAVVRISMKQGA